MRVVYIGTGEIGVPTLHALRTSGEHEIVGVVTGEDKPVGRDQRIESSAIKKSLVDAKAPVLQPPRIKEAQSILEIRALTPDVIVVMAYGQILPRDILEIPRVACLNLHASLLPRHRGASPIQAAIAAGDHETGITVIYMNETLDAGDILLRHRIKIEPGETGGSLHDRLAQVGPEAARESLRLLATGKAPRVPQENDGASYAPKLMREDGRIDWRETAETIERKIRAFDPWPGAFASLAQNSGRLLKLKIFRADVVNGKGTPGQVLQADNRDFIIAAGDKALALRRVQLEGKSPMSSQDFVRGHAGLIGQQVE
jgi:methionyl-tRNA formyltransferase